MSGYTTSDMAVKAIKVRSQPPPEKRSSNISRRLSRQESTRSNSGSEIFFGDSPVSVPFRWESRPGTPKVDLGERRPMPPLTPPPSYLSSPARKSVKKHHAESGDLYRHSHSSSSSSGILHNVLPKLNLIRKSHSNSNSNSSSSLSSSSSSSSSSVSSSPWSSARSTRSTPSTPEPAGGPRRKLAYHLRRREEDEEEEEDGECEESPMGNLCFGIPSRNHSSKRGCSANFIKLLLKQHS